MSSYRPSPSPPRHLPNGHARKRSFSSVSSPNPPAPIPEATKATIDSLKTTYKKRGHFDTLRTDVYKRFNESDSKTVLVKALEDTASGEISRDPTLLARERGKAAILIEGAVERGDAYRDVEKVIDGMLSERRLEIERIVRATLVAQGLAGVVKKEDNIPPPPPPLPSSSVTLSEEEDGKEGKESSQPPVEDCPDMNNIKKEEEDNDAIVKLEEEVEEKKIKQEEEDEKKVEEPPKRKSRFDIPPPPGSNGEAKPSGGGGDGVKEKVNGAS